MAAAAPETETKDMLHVEGLVVEYGPVRALQGVDIAVEEGRIVGILGPNGAGKTTLLRTISGIKRPKEGRIRFQDRDIAGLRPHRISRLGIAHVVEGRGIVEPLTVEENLLIGGYRLPRAAAVRRLEPIYELFPILATRRQLTAGNLSGGEQQMLAIGRALLPEPAVLMLDEPSMGLAPVVVEELVRSLKDVMSLGTSIVLAEQNALLTREVADVIHVLVGGRVATVERADELSDDLLELYLS